MKINMISLYSQSFHKVDLHNASDVCPSLCLLNPSVTKCVCTQYQGDRVNAGRKVSSSTLSVKMVDEGGHPEPRWHGWLPHWHGWLPH